MTATGLMAAPFPAPPGRVARRSTNCGSRRRHRRDRAREPTGRPAAAPVGPAELPAGAPSQHLPLARRRRRMDQRGAHLAHRPRHPDLLGPPPARRPRTRDGRVPALGGHLRADASCSRGVAPIHAARVPRPGRRSDRRDGLPAGAAPAEPGQRAQRDLPRRRRVRSTAESAVAGRGVEWHHGSWRICCDGAEKTLALEQSAGRAKPGAAATPMTSTMRSRETCVS